jgi:hypothetical protein
MFLPAGAGTEQRRNSDSVKPVKEGTLHVCDGGDCQIISIL